jgi:hypothetical protein
LKPYLPLLFASATLSFDRLSALFSDTYRHMSLNRFEDLKRYLYISDPTPKETNQDNESEDGSPEKSKGWWHKVELRS